MALCGGKDCRRRDEFGDLRDALRAVAAVATVRCLDVCDGPVVVVGPRSPEPAVFEKLRSPKERRDLTAHVTGAAPTDRLERRRVTGKARRTALAELATWRRRNPDSR